jgi:hypothetical protein
MQHSAYPRPIALRDDKSVTSSSGGSVASMYSYKFYWIYRTMCFRANKPISMVQVNEISP